MPEPILPWRLPYLLPSVRDIFFVLLFGSVLAGPLSNRPLADADIGWHIRAGEQILATHALPRMDSFSSTMQGEPWFAWEWLYDLGLGVLHRACGLSGVVWLCALLVATTFAWLMRLLVRRGTGLPLAVVLTLLAEGAATIHLLARPHLVTWLFSLAWFVWLERWEDSEPRRLPRWFLWLFPASMLLWVNLHGGWLFGLMLLGVYCAAGIGEVVREHDPFAKIQTLHRAKSLGAAWVASALATLANPYGWRLHAHIYRYLTDRYLMNRIDEFRSPNFHGWAERCFGALVLLTVLAMAAGGRRLRLGQLLVVLLAVFSGFYSSRNLPVSAMLLTLISGPLVWSWIADVSSRGRAWSWLRRGAGGLVEFSGHMGAMETRLRGALWPCAATVVGFALCLGAGTRWMKQAAFDEKTKPVRAVDFLEREPVAANAGPVFSTDAWGGYLIYRLYPARRVVIDDRHDLYGSGRIREYLILMQGEPGWDTVLQRWQIRTALLPQGSTLSNLLRELPQQWQVVYEDKVAVLFQKR